MRDYWKAEQIKAMLDAEESKSENERYGAYLSHSSPEIKTITLHEDALRLLYEYYSAEPDEDEHKCWVVTYQSYVGYDHPFIFKTKDEALSFIKSDTEIMVQNLKNDGFEEVRWLEYPDGSAEIFVPGEDFYYNWYINESKVE